MAIATYTAYKQEVESSAAEGLFTKNSATSTAGVFLNTTFTTAPNAGAAPGTTARVCNATTAGNLIGFNPNLLTAGTATLYLAELEFLTSSANRPVGSYVILDRLADVSGLSGTVTTAQTCNLTPSRFVGGNIFAAIQVYTSLGATTTTLTMSYTNQAAVAGQVSKAVAITATLPALTITPIPLADGDRGINSVQTVTLAASTGTAGNFGITLYKPIAVIPTGSMQPDGNTIYRSLMSCLPDISRDACLELWFSPNGGTASGIVLGKITIIEG